jgi:natural resistance-associated macrophage protein
VLSRNINRNSPKKVNDATWYNLIESALALLVSFFINVAVVATNAGNFFNINCAEADGGPYACLHPKSIQGDPSTDIKCTRPSGGYGICTDIGLSQEGTALKHGIGDAALYIWAIGLLAAGQAATMTCTYAGQIIMGGCLQIQLAPWKRVAFTRAFALGPSIVVAAVTVGSNSLFNTINEYLNVLQSVQLPFAMLPLLYFTSRTGFMGRFKSRPGVLIMNFCLAGIVLAVNGTLVVQFVEGYQLGGIIAVCCCATLYLFLCARMLFP